MPEIQIDEHEFERRYRPILTPTGGWRDFDWTDPGETEMIIVASDENRIWTTVEGDEGFVLLSSGWHYVNRLGYVITELPFDPDDSVCVYDPEDLEEWKERVASGEFED